jgi:RimJ/RimL family protein N-acetyltransferase
MLYQIHRYPADLIDVVRLAGGTRVVIRPVLPQDEDLTGAFFRDLPAASRHDRFLSPIRSLPPELLARFTNVDYADHVALVAEVFSEGRETVIAEARYVRNEDGRSADFAVSVADAWQGKGLASLMLGKLVCSAADAGITRIVGETRAGNDKMLRLARKAGFTIRPSPDIRGLMLLEKVVPSPPPGQTCSDAGKATLAA